MQRETDDADLRSDLSAQIISHYERHALQWDADRCGSGWHDKSWHERFIAAVPPGGTVLDLGCGGGQPVAVNMVSRGLRVTGVDSSPTLISLCRNRMPNDEWILADMRSLSLGRRFDGVLACDSFFHLSHNDQRAMFTVFAEHSKEGGMLMFNTGPSNGESIGSYRGDPLYHASLAPTEYAGLIDNAGFELIAHTLEDRSIGGRTAWLAARRMSISG